MIVELGDKKVILKDFMHFLQYNQLLKNAMGDIVVSQDGAFSMEFGKLLDVQLEFLRKVIIAVEKGDKRFEKDEALEQLTPKEVEQIIKKGAELVKGTMLYDILLASLLSDEEGEKKK